MSGFDLFNTNIDEDSYFGEGTPLYIETETRDPKLPTTYSQNKRMTSKKDDDPKNPPKPPEDNPISRDVSRGDAKGTQTSPAPINFDALAARIAQKNPGIRYNQDFNFQNEKTGSESNSLPTTPGNVPDPRQSVQIKTGMNAGQTVYTDDPNYQEKLDGEMPIGSREFVIDGGGSREVSQGAQKGSSNAQDVGDQGTQVSSRLNEALTGIPAYDASKYEGNADSATMQNLLSQAKSRDRRSEAFLDGSDDTQMALRAADLSQGFIKQNGVSYGRGADGNWVPISAEGVAALKADRNMSAGQDFLEQYMKKPATPADQQSSDSEMPVGASYVPPEKIKEAVSLGSPFYETDATKLDGIASWTRMPGDMRTEFTQNLPARADVSEPSHNWFATDFEIENGLDNREPLMRFSQK